MTLRYLPGAKRENLDSMNQSSSNKMQNKSSYSMHPYQNKQVDPMSPTVPDHRVDGDQDPVTDWGNGFQSSPTLPKVVCQNI